MPIRFVREGVIRKKAEIVITLSYAQNQINPCLCKTADTSPNTIPYKYYFHFTVLSSVYFSYSITKDNNLYNTTKDYIKGCYRALLLNVADYACSSAELPLIWSSEIDLSHQQIIQIASEVILDFLDYYDMDITVCLPTDQSLFVDDGFLNNLRQIIGTYYVPPDPIERPKASLTGTQKMIEKMLLDGDISGASELVRLNSLDELMSRKDKPFSAHLFRMIDNRGLTDAEVYKGALLDRKLFSKIRNGNNYTPRKATILALAISLKLSLDETQDLLQSAGYALSDSSEVDIIVGYFLDHKIFDIFKVNEALYSFGLKGLGNTSE